MDNQELAALIKGNHKSVTKQLSKIDEKVDSHAERIACLETRQNTIFTVVKWALGIVGSCIAGCVIWMVKK